MYLLKTSFCKFTDADNTLVTLFSLWAPTYRFLLIPSILTHNNLHIQVLPNVIKSGENKEVINYLESEFWERSFCSHVLLHLRTYLLRIFFRSWQFLSEKQQFGLDPLRAGTSLLWRTYKPSETKPPCSLSHGQWIVFWKVPDWQNYKSRWTVGL